MNGLDFWNNSDAIPAAQAPKMGTIVHRRVVDAKSGADAGRADGRDRVGEARRQAAAAGADAVRLPRRPHDSRTIDRITTLTALDERVVFKDNKEAFIGMRVARGLEQPDDKPEIFTDASGKPATDQGGRQHRRDRPVRRAAKA